MSGDTRALTDTPAFLDSLRTATRIAGRSPSSHNCQPWGVAALVTPGARTAAERLLGGRAGRQYLAVCTDHERSLTALPAHALEMTLSCGMYWGLLTEALADLGRPVTVTRFLTPAEAGTIGEHRPAGWSPLLVAALDQGTADPAALGTLAALAIRRRTNRGPYRTDAPDTLPPVPPSADGTAVITHLTDSRRRTAAAGLIARHGGRDFAHRDAWRETHSFIRRDDAEAERRGNGFTLEQLFGRMPWPRRPLTRLTLAPATMRALSLVGYHRQLAAQLAQAVRRAPTLVMATVPNEEPETCELVKAGADIIRYWLAATDLAFALHPVSVLLQHDDVRQLLRDELGTTGRPIFLARLGTPTTEVSPSPRHPAGTSRRRL